MDDDQSQGGDDYAHQETDYGDHADDTFNVWVELGALNRDLQRVLDFSPMHRHIIKFKSSSPEAEEFIHDPLSALIAAGIPDVHAKSRVTSTILHHERGLRKRIIRAAVNVEAATGDVAIEYDKETW